MEANLTQLSNHVNTHKLGHMFQFIDTYKLGHMFPFIIYNKIFYPVATHGQLS
jgi:hypothetical protein